MRRVTYQDVLLQNCWDARLGVTITPFHGELRDGSAGHDTQFFYLWSCDVSNVV